MRSGFCAGAFGVAAFRQVAKDLESTQGLFMQALAQVYVRQTARSRNLVVDAFPATTVELLPEWENTWSA